MLSSLVDKYSGIVVNQNQPPALANDYFVVSNTAYVQEFFLPDNYQRGSDAAEARYPDLAGLQLLVSVAEGYADTAALDYVLEVDTFGVGWTTLASGTAIGAPADHDKTWFDILFADPVPISEEIAGERMRFSFTGRSSAGAEQAVPVVYDGTAASIDGQRIEASLVPGVPYPFNNGGIPAFLYMDEAGDVTYSVQQGITRAWYSIPNPLPQFARGYQADGTTPLRRPGGTEDLSFCFRILGLVADEGVDFLGNRYRSAVTTAGASSLSASAGSTNSMWLSEPCPSRFGLKSLYFDISTDDGSASVFDGVLIDPITPGVYCSIYYSNDGEPVQGSDAVAEAAWDNKLWTRIPQTYRIAKRDNYLLPEPVTARYVKLEFSHLIARSYSPGTYQKPIAYKKHPKWVLDYFVARTAANNSQFIANRVGVVYDALDLAYNYYLDDIHQQPLDPIPAQPTDRQAVQQFLATNNDRSDQVDPTTLNQIKLVMDQYRMAPAYQGKLDWLPTTYAQAETQVSYPTEGNRLGWPTITDVSSTNRDSVVFELDHPVMYFYLTCRHRYRELQATFEHDRAYFVGLREISFSRQRYTTAYDTPLYIEPAGDLLNIERNDFQREGDSLVVALSPGEAQGLLS
jgi:hypothetical protein